MNLGAPTGTPARFRHAVGQTGMKTNDNFPQVVASQRLAISELEDLSPRAAGSGLAVGLVFTPQEAAQPRVVGVLPKFSRLAEWFVPAEWTFLAVIPDFLLGVPRHRPTAAC